MEGLAQQGESMVVCVFLPDFGSFSDTGTINMVLGAQKIREDCGLSWSNSASLGNLEEAGMSDNAMLLSSAVYLLRPSGEAETEGVSVAAQVDESSGAIRYEFQGRPFAFFNAGSMNGREK